MSDDSFKMYYNSLNDELKEKGKTESEVINTVIT